MKDSYFETRNRRILNVKFNKSRVEEKKQSKNHRWLILRERKANKEKQ
jgi:hypothetical protein